jgi:hypothetical protein
MIKFNRQRNVTPTLFASSARSSAPAYPRVPCDQRLALVRHGDLEQFGEDQATNERNVSHREILPCHEGLPTQSIIEIAHATQGFVALVQAPLLVLVNLHVRAKTGRGMVEVNAVASSTSSSARRLIM